jgi:hypothetical protein
MKLLKSNLLWCQNFVRKLCFRKAGYFFIVACLTFILPVYMAGHNILQNTKVKFIVTIKLKHEIDFMQAYCVFVPCSRYFSV